MKYISISILTAIIISGVLFSSCLSGRTSQPLTTTDGLKSIYTKMSTDVIYLGDHIKDIKLVPLETTKESIIGEITQLMVYNDRIYIRDHVSNFLLIFDINGKYISKINTVGHGPGEYVQLDYFHIDFERNELILTDLMSYYVLRYDINGKFIKKIKIPIWIEGIAPYHDGGYVLNTNYRDNSHTLEKEHKILFVDSMMNITHSFFPYKSENINKARFLMPNNAAVYLYNKTYHLFSPFSDTIFSIMPEKLIPSYSINIENNMFDQSYLNKPEQLKEYMERGSGYFALNNVFETDSTIVFNCLYKPGTWFYSKNDLLAVHLHSTFQSGTYDKMPLSHIIGVHNNMFIDELLNNEIFQANNSNNKSFMPPFSDFVGKIKLDDNPILMFYKIRTTTPEVVL